jgi:hypothetical protein
MRARCRYGEATQGGITGVYGRTALSSRVSMGRDAAGDWIVTLGLSTAEGASTTEQPSVAMGTS